jgi:hypothetical protein
MKRIAIAVLFLGACGPEAAEVGSVPPVDAGQDRWPHGLDGSIGVPEGGSMARCDAEAPLRLYYRNLSTDATSTDINYIIKIENATGMSLAMNTLEARYYFTNELALTSPIDVFYTDTCCSNKRTDFNDEIVKSVQPLPAKPIANAYLQIAFQATAGVLAFGDAVQVEIGFHDVAYARSMTQSNDYSFAASAAGTQAEWNDCPGPRCASKFTSCALTLHRDGVLVWGTPP